MTHSTAALLAATLALVTFTHATQAATFYTISGVTSATSGTDGNPATNLIQGIGTGFSAAEPHDKLSSSNWFTNAPNGGGGDYFGPTPTPAARLIFDLGEDRILGDINIWGYADTNANGARVFDLRFARDVEGPAGFGGAIPYNPTFTLDSQLETPRKSFSFDKPLIARYVELIPTDNFRGFGTPGGDRVGLGEVAFGVFNSVPEPSSLLLLGLGLMGLAARRSRFRTACRQGIQASLGLLVALLCIAGPTAHAGSVTTITPTGVTLNSSSAFYPVGQLINGSGLSGPPFDSTSTHSSVGSNANSWVTNDPAPGGGDYFTENGGANPLPVITFDLGGTYVLNETNIWNYAQSNAGNQSKEITIEFSQTGTGGLFSNAVNVSLDLDTSGPIEVQTFSFASIAANAVRFTITDNFFGIAPSGGDRAGLGEVKFGNYVPEPSTVLLLGLGLVGLAARRSRRFGRKRITACLIAVVATCSASTAEAGEIIGIDLFSPASVSLDASSQFYSVNNLVNVSGFGTTPTLANYSTNFHAAAAAGTTWVTNAFTPDYFLNGGPDPIMTFDLGQPLFLTDVVLWGYHFTSNSNNEARLISAEFSDNGGVSFGTTVPLTNVQSTGLPTTLSLGQTIYADTVRFTITDNFGDNRVGLGEVMFIGGTRYVPEPSTVLLLGLGLVGLASRRSRKGSNLGTGKIVAALVVLCVASFASTAQAGVANLVANWKLDETVGTSGAGSVKNSWSTDFNGTPTGITFGVPGATDKTGTAGDFNGGTDRIAVGYDSALNSASFTYTTWARVDGGAGAYRAAVTSRRSGAGVFQGYILYASPTNNWEFWTGDDAANQWDIITGPAAVIGDTVHLAISFDDATNTKSFYIDGTLVGSSTTQTYSPNTASQLNIGAGADTGGSFRFNGLLDDAAYFNRALEIDEIQLIMNSSAFRAATIPEPSSILLLGLGLVGLASRRSRQR